jgi:XapX domain-containing protein
MEGSKRTFKCQASMAYGDWVATASHSDLRAAGGNAMKVSFLSFVVGLGVGVLYGLIRVKSPAPPIVALLGLLGMVLGEQFGIWLHTKKIDVSHAASVCLAGERYDRPHPSEIRLRGQIHERASSDPSI